MQAPAPPTCWAQPLRAPHAQVFYEEPIMATSEPSKPASADFSTTQGANIVGLGVGAGPGPAVMAASTLTGSKVMSADGEPIGKIAAIMLDMRGARIAYAVLSTGGFLGLGDTLHALPWSALTLDTDDHCFVLDAPAERVKNAPGFDKNHWPSMTDLQ
jgi:sporulation protein YlmC with PRC-barrel domain